MDLTSPQQAMLDGTHGTAVRKSMQILTALGKIYGAEKLIPVTSVQIAGVSYDNLGEAGLRFLAEMAAGGGQARVLTTLNPAGMDVEAWQPMGIPAEFAAQQIRVLDAFSQMGVLTTCSCTPYLIGNLPHFGEHIAWAESSAVCYANAVLGARTNREGGPSALAAALTGFTPAYGLHLDANRQPSLRVDVQAEVRGTASFGALGQVIGKALETRAIRLPYITGIAQASLEELKSFCASLATYGGAAMFHMPGITPEADGVRAPVEGITITSAALQTAQTEMSTANPIHVDFVSLGCPHLTIEEIRRIAERLRGRKVTKTFWITTARPTKRLADQMGYTRIIEESGALFAVDTCCVVAPIRGRFQAIATDSAKACYYAATKNNMQTLLRSFDEVIEEALR